MPILTRIPLFLVMSETTSWKADRKPIVSEDDDPRVLCSYVPVPAYSIEKDCLLFVICLNQRILTNTT